MKTLRFFFILLLFLLLHSIIVAQNVSSQFSELKGMEDAQGNTHLLYTVYSHQFSPYYESGRDDIFNFIPGTLIDTIFLYSGFYCHNWTGGWVLSVGSYDFWKNDLSKYIYTGYVGSCLDGNIHISRFDSQFVYESMFSVIEKIIISKQNDSIIFALPNLVSKNGGIIWDTLQLDHQLVSVSLIDDKVFFSNGSTTSDVPALFKSTDSGNTFTLVDTGGTDWSHDFYYDVDANHIYRTYSTGYPNRSLKVSANQGDAFTWQIIYSTDNNFLISLDESQSGAIYLADGKKIFYSSNYGNTFSLYKELDNRIVGIYKKPNSDKLYAATKYKIYKITNNSITLIKSLPIPEELLAYHPLAVGNKWVYDFNFVDWNLSGYQDIFVREIQSEELKPNGKKYFKITEKYIQMGFESSIYERIDSVEGKVYRYLEDCPNSEQFVEDLVMDVGDTTFASRFGYCIEHASTELLSQQNFNQWGINGTKRNYLSNDLFTANYFLATDIGLNYFKLSDDNGEKTFNLKGMLKNGIVYGDTIITDVNDEIKMPMEFSLSQNYPNPFNPTTKIIWQSPISGWQTLKVYDVLGNEVITLVDEYRNAGIYDIDFNASRLSSGVYFYQLKTDKFLAAKKMILLK